MKKFQLFYLVVAATAVIYLAVGQALALTADQQVQIEVAVATGDSTTIDATARGIIKAAIINGEDPATIAELIASIAVTAAADLDDEAIAAVTKAVSSGAVAGAIEGALETGQDVLAVVQAASSGATSGALQAAFVINPDDTFISSISQAAQSGALAGAASQANNTTLTLAELTQAVRTGSAQGVTLAQQLIADLLTPEEPEAFETDTVVPTLFVPHIVPPVVETPPIPDDPAGSPI